MDLKFSPQANADLLDIWSYIATDNSKAAEKLVAQIKAACTTIMQFPLGMGKERLELAKDIRSHAVDRYIIFYRAKADIVEVVRVMHSARDIANNFNS